MNMQHLPDFPPLPKCFNHLVINSDSEARSIRVHLNQFGERVNTPDSRFSARSEGLAKTDELDDFDCYIMNGTRSNSLCLHKDVRVDDRMGHAKCNSLKDSSKQTGSRIESSGHDVSDQSPFLKLQTSLLKLQREMKDLRYLDITLFCQLLSLHEAIQEFKLSFSDRYSETGSEYSLGSASYMGSMTSLNDDSDWGEDGPLVFSSQDQPDNSELSENTESTQSASGLLKQITDLAMRAHYDF